MSNSGSGGASTRDVFVDAISAALHAPNTDKTPVVKAFYASSRVNRLVANACFKYRVSHDFLDEIKQDLAILLIGKFLASVDASNDFYLRDPDKIYNVLHVTACNIARRKAGKTTESSIEDMTRDDLETATMRMHDRSSSLTDILNEEQNVAALVEQNLDHSKAVADFNRRFENQLKKNQELELESQRNHHMFINPTRQQVLVTPLEPKAAPKAEPLELSGLAIELRQIMEKLDLTIPEMASLLNLTKGKFNSYIYGIVRNIPKKVIDDARTLETEGFPQIEEISKKFDGFSMEQISDHWVARLRSVNSAEATDDELFKQVVNVLDVDRATFWRWRNRQMRPRLRQLQEYDLAIEKHVQRTTGAGPRTQQRR